MAALVLLLGAGVAVMGIASAHPVAGDGISQARAAVPVRMPPISNHRTASLRAPFAFELNHGQSDASVRFLARGRGYSLFLTPQEAALVLPHGAAASKASNTVSVVRMKLVDANPEVEVSGSDRLPGKVNYMIGNNPAKWHRNVPEFARVRYHEVYPGIDLVFYGNAGKLEYDFEVAPEADPRLVSLLVQSSDNAGSGLKIDGSGDLTLATDGGAVRFAAPRIYQKKGTDEQPVAGRFALRDGNRVGFEIGNYDRSRTLVIDPILSYSTYLGGTGAESCSAITGAMFTPGCPAIAVDSASNAYIAGATTSTVNFPNPAGAATANTVNGPADVFITKFDNTGTVQIFTTYLGGSGTDTPSGIAIDSGFGVTIAGTTNSTDFPHTPSAYQSAPEPIASGNKHVFVTKLDPTGSAQQYSTYLSGNGIDVASGVALDLQGKIYVTGTTTSTDPATSTVKFPATVGGFQTSSMATNQFFMTQIDPTLSGAQSIPYSTYFGGGNPVNGVAVGGGIAVDSTGNVFITGGTNFLHIGISSDFPILNAAQGCLDTPQATAPAVTTPPTPQNCSPAVSGLDAFVAKISPPP